MAYGAQVRGKLMQPQIPQFQSRQRRDLQCVAQFHFPEGGRWDRTSSRDMSANAVDIFLRGSLLPSEPLIQRDIQDSHKDVPIQPPVTSKLFYRDLEPAVSPQCFD